MGVLAALVCLGGSAAAVPISPSSSSPTIFRIDPSEACSRAELAYIFKIYYDIEDLFLRPAVKKAIILLLSRAQIKVLKDALAHLGPYQTLMWLGTVIPVV